MDSNNFYLDVPSLGPGLGLYDQDWDRIGTTTYTSANGVYPLVNGLVSKWSGNGNAYDLMNVNHGTLENGNTFETGIQGLD